MYRLFLDNSVNYGTIESVPMHQIKNIIMDKFIYYQTIYEDFGSFINSNHVLIKLCSIFNNYLDSTDIYKAVDSDLHNICSTLKITSYSNYGDVSYNMFYTIECLLVAVTFNDQIPYFNKQDWSTMRPIRCLNHPCVSMEILTAPVEKKDMTKGLSTIGIDIPAFAYQYKKWHIQNMLKIEDYKEPVYLFLTKYVIPNMLNEYIDIALRNRLSFIDSGEIPTPERHERAFVRDYEQMLVRPITNILNLTKDSEIPYFRALKQIPLVFSKNYFNAIPKELNGLNTYMYWVQVLTLIDWLTPITLFVTNSQINNTDIAKTFVRVDRFINSSGCLNRMPNSLHDDFNLKYGKIKQFFK